MRILREYINLFELDDVDDPHELVFVYGSLKRGFANNRMLGRHSKFLGSAKTEPHFDMVNLGSYPAAIVGKHSLTGEVYEVDQAMMRYLDKVESLYRREKVPVFVDSGQVSAWIYLFYRKAGGPKIKPDDDGYVTWVAPLSWVELARQEQQEEMRRRKVKKR